MINNVIFWKHALILITVFAAAVVISAFIGSFIVTDSVLFPLSDVRSAVSFADAAVYSLEHCTSSAFQMALLLFSSFSMFSKVCVMAVVLYRGGCLGFAVSAISRGMVMASAGGMLTVKAAMPILSLYFLCSILMISFSSATAYSVFHISEVSHKKCCQSIFANFAVISGTVFLLDIVKVWLI